MPFPEICEKHRKIIEENEYEEPLRLGPVTAGKQMIVAYHLHNNDSGYPGVTVLVDDLIFDYQGFEEYAYRMARQNELWQSIIYIVREYYWR